MEYTFDDLDRNEKNRITERKFQSIERGIINKIIPQTYPREILYYCSSRRNKIIKHMGFALLSWDWLDYIVEFLKDKRCLEVMAGSGSLTYALKQKGVNIIATDNFSWDGMSDCNWNSDKEYWTDIENIDAIEAVEKYGEATDVIIMSWAYMDDTAYRVLQKMREVNPDCIMIFIGESEGGCTADISFYEAIYTVDDDLIDKANQNFKSWEGIYDRIWLVK